MCSSPLTILVNCLKLSNVLFGLCPICLSLPWGAQHWAQNARRVLPALCRGESSACWLHFALLQRKRLLAFLAARAPFSSLLLLPMQTLKMYRNSCKWARVVSPSVPFPLVQMKCLEGRRNSPAESLISKKNTSQLTRRNFFLRCSCLFSTAVRSFL